MLLGGLFDLDSKVIELNKLSCRMEAIDFWNDKDCSVSRIREKYF